MSSTHGRDDRLTGAHEPRLDGPEPEPLPLDQARPDRSSDDRSSDDVAPPRHDTGVPPTSAGDAPDGRTGRQGAERQEDARDATPLQVLGAAVKEFAIVVGMALVLSFVVKTWLLQAFYIPSGSMEDTLQVNDRVIVSKLTPGPVDLKRGDIIVFGDPGEWVETPAAEEHGTAVTVFRDALTFIGLLPDNAENHLIKRVIGLPGDTVVCCDAGGRLTVNGAPIKEPYLKPGVSPSDQNFHITVPSGRVWVMGDNRSGSADSRAHDAPEEDGRTGSVDMSLIVGRAVLLVWPLDHLAVLSNPSSTFADVPSPRSGASTGDSQGSPGTTGQGGAEVPGGDGATTGGG